MRAGAGNDSITIKGGTNYFLYAEAGNDNVVIEAGKNSLELGDGDDTVTITNDWKLRDKETDIVAGKSTITGGAGSSKGNHNLVGDLFASLCTYHKTKGILFII